MGRVRARFKNVLITGVILTSTLFLWMVTVSKQGKKFVKGISESQPCGFPIFHCKSESKQKFPFRHFKLKHIEINYKINQYMLIYSGKKKIYGT